ncbi:hypothetical protein [Lichenibacterium dinghuense]|uniref:hypothetical protein n=1 Tax=Lichenibacterium dinghuense TaxID=2895977 RepID=UPI001F1F1082|nr:hypothetical protein [Lichenibacterium sp. 6Y81]
MRSVNVPALGARYWAALVLASAFGANTGDFAAHDLHLGHAIGLIPLAVIFGAILFAESRATVATEAFYWFAIVTMRTAATNVADLLDHDLHLAPLGVIAVLALILLALVFSERGSLARLDARDGVPDTDARYWATMLTAGVLGTALGDHCADDLGLDAGSAAAVNLLVLAALLGLGLKAGFRVKAAYWLAVVSVRTAGTNVGDWLASHGGLGLGLPLSTTLTGLAFGALVALWRPRPALVGLRAA